MSFLADRIREMLSKTKFIEKGTIREGADDDPALAGIVFKSFNSIALPKTAADFASNRKMVSKFAYAEDEEQLHDFYKDYQSEEDIDRLIGDSPADGLGLDPDKLPPREEWIEKKEKEEQRRVDKENAKIEKEQAEQEKELIAQQKEQQAQAMNQGLQ